MDFQCEHIKTYKLKFCQEYTNFKIFRFFSNTTKKYFSSKPLRVTRKMKILAFFERKSCVFMFFFIYIYTVQKQSFV